MNIDDEFFNKKDGYYTEFFNKRVDKNALCDGEKNALQKTSSAYTVAIRTVRTTRTRPAAALESVSEEDKSRHLLTKVEMLQNFVS